MNIDALNEFFHTYFHQDCFFEHKNTDGVLQYYFSVTESYGALERLRADLVEFVALHTHDVNMSLYGALECFVSPKGFGLTPEQWLMEIVNSLDEEIRRRKVAKRS